ncbi:glutamate--cysteine ligase [Frigidibacter albus]|uniref:Glutamate--cysteine ligase n=1 Tax=Frigidibacter albus TaxID=1465486 RepID=A0A6L8VH33_9RHOB|nr:glutamate--cysteine ligase [Frigidibacter albus]MZQ89687.1 glutamate--cysteine ligase [Frigidibacter albus]NBE31593.1 glutamate--cysteine ligase [Frigidibacter albus]GGH54679.1 glutamate--cysteine ligase [Frigidibacter albus]
MSIPQSGGGPIEHFDELAAYIASGEKPKADWRIGTEHEKFGFTTGDLLPLPYEGAASIRAMLEGLQARFGWTPIFEQDKIIGLTRDGANVSLEPGGQFELSGAPLETLHQTAAELDDHLREVAEIAGPMGAGFAGLGAAPVWTHAQMPMMPKGRYRLMTDYMGRVGTLGTQMMYRTCTVQVNLDFSSEADMVQKMRVALSLQPVATALCASSPFLEGKPNGHKSWRSRIWRDLDAARTGMLPFMFEDGAGYERWVDYVLDVPMYFVYRDGQYINALGQSFRDFLNGKLPALPGEVPTLSDWADHMTTVFPEARVKKYIEMRGADAGSRDQMVALPALWVGLTYDQGALDAATDLVKGWTHETREGLRKAASIDGLQGEAGGVRLQELAGRVLEISAAGLAARGLGEEVLLDPFRESVASGKVPADRLLDAFHGEWQGDLGNVYEATRL